jgi:hypothetical protein
MRRSILETDEIKSVLLDEHSKQIMIDFNRNTFRIRDRYISKFIGINTSTYVQIFGLAWESEQEGNMDKVDAIEVIHGNEKSKLYVCHDNGALTMNGVLYPLDTNVFEVKLPKDYIIEALTVGIMMKK